METTTLQKIVGMKNAIPDPRNLEREVKKLQYSFQRMAIEVSYLIAANLPLELEQKPLPHGWTFKFSGREAKCCLAVANPRSTYGYDTLNNYATHYGLAEKLVSDIENGFLEELLAFIENYAKDATKELVKVNQSIATLQKVKEAFAS